MLEADVTTLRVTLQQLEADLAAQTEKTRCLEAEVAK
jgi:hypothetical protein